MHLTNKVLSSVLLNNLHLNGSIKKELKEINEEFKVRKLHQKNKTNKKTEMKKFMLEHRSRFQKRL